MWYKVVFVFNWEGIAMHPRSQVINIWTLNLMQVNICRASSDNYY